MDLGELFRKLREQRGISMSELADGLADIVGHEVLSWQGIGRIERGNTKQLSLEVFTAYCKYFDISADEILNIKANDISYLSDKAISTLHYKHPQNGDMDIAMLNVLLENKDIFHEIMASLYDYCFPSTLMIPSKYAELTQDGKSLAIQSDYLVKFFSAQSQEISSRLDKSIKELRDICIKDNIHLASNEYHC